VLAANLGDTGQPSGGLCSDAFHYCFGHSTPPLVDSDSFLFATFFLFYFLFVTSDNHTQDNHHYTVVNCMGHLHSVSVHEHFAILYFLAAADANPSVWVTFLFIFVFRAVVWGRTGVPREDVVAVGSMAYGSQSLSARPAGLLEPDLADGAAEPDRQ